MLWRPSLQSKLPGRNESKQEIKKEKRGGAPMVPRPTHAHPGVPTPPGIVNGVGRCVEVIVRGVVVVRHGRGGRSCGRRRRGRGRGPRRRGRGGGRGCRGRRPGRRGRRRGRGDGDGGGGGGGWRR